MWPNQRSPYGQPDEYQAMQQMRRAQELQQLAIQQPGTGWAGAAMALIGGWGGRRMEERAYDRLSQLQTDRAEQERMKREMAVAALSGGDMQKAAAAFMNIPGMEDAGLKLMTDANKPTQVPDAILSRYTPASIAQFSKSGDYASLVPMDANKPQGKLPTGWTWGEAGNAMMIPGTESFHANQAKAAGSRGAPSVVVNLPNGQQAIPLGKPAQNNAQEQLVNLNQQIQSVRTLADNYADEYLTLTGSAKNKYRELADWSGLLPLSEGGKEKLRNQTTFQNQAMRMYLDFRRWATGSAASNQEDERIMQSMFNLDQSPEQFKASIQSFANDIEQRVGLHQQMVQSGIPIHEVQAIFRDTPLLQSINPEAAPSSDANVIGGEMSQELARIRADSPNAAPTTASKPTLEQFLAAAREDNPGVPEAELIAYYNQTYR